METVFGLFVHRDGALATMDDLIFADIPSKDIGLAVWVHDTTHIAGYHDDEVSAIDIKDIGLIAIAGPLADALLGTAIETADGAPTYDFVGALIGMGLSEEEARTCYMGVKDLALLVTVRVPADKSIWARDIFSHNGAVTNMRVQ